MDEKLPKRFGRYEVRSHVGAGGMGFVLLGHDPKLERPVAIKVVPAHLRSMPTVAERFKREALALARLSHPNIVRVFDVGEEAGLLYYVMEFLAGQGLDKRRAKDGPKAPFVKSEFVKTFRPLAEALSVVHDAKLVHRDIKPANIIGGVPERGPVLTDFGLAWLDDEGKLTQSGLIVGTGRYMAPEQVMGEPPGPLQDLYALGATMFEYATGRLPFEHLRGEQLLIARMEAELPPARKLAPEVPEALAAVIDRCVQMAPADRFQSAGELAEALEEGAKRSERPVRSSSAARPSPSPAPTRAMPAPEEPVPRKALYGALGALALAGLIGGALALSWSRPAPIVARAVEPAPPVATPPPLPVSAPNQPAPTPARPAPPAEAISVIAPVSENAQQIALAARAGRLLAGWTRPSGEIVFAESADGGRRWTRLPPDRRLSGTTGVSLRLAATLERFHVVYTAPERDGKAQVLASWRPAAGGDWSEPRRLGRLSRVEIAPVLSAGDGLLLAAWQSAPASGGPMHSWSSDGGQTWTPAEATPGSAAERPFALVHNGHGFLIWEMEALVSKAANVFLTRAAGPGQPWSEPRSLLVTSPGIDRGFPSACSSGRSIYLQWTEKAVTGRRTLVSESPDGGLTFTPGRLLGSWPCNNRKNAIAVAGKRLWSTWEDKAGRGVVWTTSEDGGRTWQREKILYNYITLSKPAALAVTENGECWIVWADEAGQISAMRLP